MKNLDNVLETFKEFHNMNKYSITLVTSVGEYDESSEYPQGIMISYTDEETVLSKEVSFNDYTEDELYKILDEEANILKQIADFKKLSKYSRL